MSQRLAVSMPSPISVCLSVPSSLAQFSPGFGVPFLEKTGSKQKPVALLQSGFCLPSVPVCSLSRAPSGDTGCSCSWKRGKEDCSLSTAFQKRGQGLILPLFPWVPSFFLRSLRYLVAVASQGWYLVSPRLVQRKQREPMASQGGGTTEGWSFFFCLSRTELLDGLSSSQLTISQAAQIFPKP